MCKGNNRIRRESRSHKLEEPQQFGTEGGTTIEKGRRKLLPKT